MEFMGMKAESIPAFEAEGAKTSPWREYVEGEKSSTFDFEIMRG